MNIKFTAPGRKMRIVPVLTQTLLLCALLLAGVHDGWAQSKIWGVSTKGSGYIYSMNTDGSGIQSQHVFSTATVNPGNANQGYPNNSLIEYGRFAQMDGKLYGTRIAGGLNAGASVNGTTNSAGVLFQFDPVTGQDSTLYSFSLPTGCHPEGTLTAVGGVLYGTTTFGGNTSLNQGNGYGTIFSFNPATAEYVVLYKFSGTPDGGQPNGSLLYNPTDGLLYGKTVTGGPTINNPGTFFSIDPVAGSSSFKVLANTGGSFGLTLYNGLIYGIVASTIFSYDPATTIMTNLFSIPAGANSGLTLYNGIFYGLTMTGGTSNNGSLYSFDPSSNTFTTRYSFLAGVTASSGNKPSGDLEVYNGQLWGTTTAGGLNSNQGGNGVLFSYDPVASNFTPQYAFTSNDALNGTYLEGVNTYAGVTAYNGKLYGILPTGSFVGSGDIFSWDPAAGTLQSIAYFNQKNVGGNAPQAAPYYYNKLLYGTCNTGGFTNQGIFYSIDPATSAFTKIQDMNSPVTGVNPSAPVAVNGKLYYVTTTGGGHPTNGVGNAEGAIVQYDPATGKTTTPYVFSGDYSPAGGGGLPQGPLLPVGNVLYGLCDDGGNGNGDGTIFSYDLGTHTYTPLFYFDDTDPAIGGYAVGNLVYINGLLCGMTVYGGAFGSGNIFSFDPVSKTYTDLYDFGSVSGVNFLVAYNNKIYGIANSGGTGGSGLVFSLDPVSKDFTDLHDFAGTEFNVAQMVAYKGQLLGTSLSGGANGGGFVFSLDPVSKTYKSLHDFTLAEPANPYGLTLLKSTPTITFGNISATYGQSDVALTATSTNTNAANPVTYTFADPSIASIVNGKLHILKAGTTLITAGQLEDDDDYADTVQPTLTVAKAALTVSATPASIFFGDPIPVNFTASYTGFIGTDDASLLTGTPVFTTTATSASQPGNYPINVDTTGMSAVNYHFVLKPGQLTINPAAITIQFATPPATITYGDASFDPAATATSGATPVYTSNNTAVASITGDNKVQITGAGTATITATFPATASYSGGSKDLTITVAKKNITLTVNNTYMQVGSALPTFTAGFNGLVNGDAAAVISPAPLFATTASSSSAAGTYPITVTNINSLTAANYTIDPNYQQGTLTIGTVQYNGADTRTYGAANYDAAAVSNNGSTPTYSSSNAAVAVITADNKIQITGAGQTVITASFPASGSDPAVSVTQTLTVQKAPLTIKAADASREYGQPNPVFQLSYQGFVNNDDATALLTPAIGGTAATTTSAPGAYPIIPYNATAANYNITYASGTLTVTTASQTIQFGPLQGVYIGNADFDPAAVTSSGLPVTYTSSNPNVATISNGLIHIVNAGTTTITASQAGNGDYLAASSVQQTLTVSGLQTTISLPPLSSMVYGAPDFTVAATTNNNTTAIVYSSSNPAVATIAANGVIHLTGAGATNITASQAGNASYGSASSVPQTLNVTKAPLVVTAYNQTVYQGQTPAPFVIGYSGFVNGDDTTVLTAKAMGSTPANTGSGIGTYPIYVSGAAAANYSFNYVQGVLSVQPAQPQSLSFNALPLELYGNADFDPGAVSTSGQPVVYASSDPKVATIVNGQIHLTGAGTVTITATQPGGNGFSPAASISQVMTVAKGQLTIRPDDVTLGAGQALPAFTISYTGFVNGDDSSSLTKLPVVSTTAESGLNFGQYNIIASGAVSSNYDITYQPGILTIGAGTDQLNAFSSGPGQVTVSIFTGTVQKATIQFYSLGGQLVTEQQVQLFKNVNNFTLYTGNITAGIYIVKVWGEVSKMSQKIKIK